MSRIISQLDNKNHLTSILILIFSVFLVYLPSLNNGFVNWDDDAHLLENPFIQTLNPAGIGEMFTTTVNKIYIPLTNLSFAVEWHFFKDSAFIYHFDNLILHVFNVVFVYLIMIRLGLARLGGMFAALLFGLHPIHVESVAWVTERKDVLFGFFYLLALIFYLHFLSLLKEKPRKFILELLYYSLVIFFGLLSLLAKPMALSLPIVLWILDWWVKRKDRKAWILEKLILAFLFIPIIWISYRSHIHLDGVFGLNAVLVWIWCFVFYINKLIFPIQFALIYSLPKPISILNPVYVICSLEFLIILYSIWRFRHQRSWLLAWAWYFSTIFFVLRLVPGLDTNIVGDRFMYLPCLGFCYFISERIMVLIEKYKKKKIERNFVMVIGPILILILSLKTIDQTKVWANSISLWENQLKVQPSAATALAYQKLADGYLDQINEGMSVGAEDIAKIRGNYQKSLKIYPGNANAYFGLGLLESKLGQYNQAERYLKETLKRSPDHFEAMYEIGELKLVLGEYASAVEYFRQALRINPGNKSLIKRIYGALKDVGNRSEDPRYQFEAQRLKAIYPQILK